MYIEPQKYGNSCARFCLLGTGFFLLVTFGTETYSQSWSITFSNVSQAAGIQFSTASYGDPIWGDFNNDGNIDLFAVNHGQHPFLFRNNGDLTFTNIRPSSGIVDKKDRHGSAWGDYDNDGDLDLFVSVGGGRGTTVGQKSDELYENDGNGNFTDVTAATGVTNSFGRGRGVLWVDFNNDGFSDLSIMNAGSSQNVLYRNELDGTFTDVASSAGIADIKGENPVWFDYDEDGYMDLFVSNGFNHPDQLWRNNGTETFSNVTASAGLAEKYYSKGAAVGDYDNDGDLDLYITRGYSDTNDAVNWNPASIRFSDQESRAEDGLDFKTTGNRVTFNLYLNGRRRSGDVYYGSRNQSPTSAPFALTSNNASGSPTYVAGQDKGYFVWHDADSWHIRWSSNGNSAYFYGALESNGAFLDVQPINFNRETPAKKEVTNTLYRNNGDGTFSDETTAVGIGWNRMGSTQNDRSAVWGDYDNDGDLDLYLVKVGSFVRNSINRLFENKGDGSFSDVTASTRSWVNVNGRGNSAAWGDFNNDGFLDLYVLNGWGRAILDRAEDNNRLVFGPHTLLKNNGNENNWFKLMLTGTASNRDAIGSKVRVDANGTTQYREVNGHGGGVYFSQGTGPLHFGLGAATEVDDVTIYWPSGTTQLLTEVEANTTLDVSEPSNSNSPPSFVQDPFSKVNATVGVYYRQSIRGKAADPDGDALVFSKTSGPDWLEILPRGTIRGTPGRSGRNRWTVMVEDGNGGRGWAEMEITVNENE